MKIQDVIRCLEEVAPLSLQEGYDNAGLLVGDPEQEVNAFLLCLDSIEATIEEAVQKKCQLIVAHHPIVFSGLKTLTGKNYIERTVIKAVQHNIAIYVAHTNLDNVRMGVNQKIAEKIGLIDGRILRPKSGTLRKLVTFCPQDQADSVRQALFNAGAGTIGKYDHCSFNTSGTGTFRAGNESNPYVGKKGEEHLETEVRIETIFPTPAQHDVIGTLLEVHPYEEVAYDIYTLENKHQQIGSGLIGRLKEPVAPLAFLKQLKTIFNAGCIRYTSPHLTTVQTIAVCGGSGSFLLEDCLRSGADVFITSDMKYHQFFDAENKLIIADIGHYESEQFTTELFHELLMEKFPTFAIHFSEVKTNPVNYL